MPVALRRFRTTVATAILGMAGRSARRLRHRASLAATVAAAVLTWRPVGAADAPPTRAAAGRLLAAGEDAAERGWFVAARDHWRAAADAAERAGDSATQAQARARLTRLDAFARGAAAGRLHDLLDPGDAAAGSPTWSPTWSAAEWRPSWRVAAAGVSATERAPAVVGRLLVWSTGRSVHAVACADGAAAWPVGDGRDTLVFPRDSAPPAGTGRGPGTFARAATPVVVSTAGRGFAAIDRGRDGDQLVCLDLSDPAQGRLAWSATAAAVPRTASQSQVTFDGPPTVDDELCAVVIHADDGRGRLTLAVFDARDGTLRWSHDLGPSVAGEGIGPPRGCRRPCLAEDRIVVDTLAGTVWGFDRDGAVIWTAASPPAANGPGAVPRIPSAIFAAGRLLLCAGDGSAITAIEPRHGGSIWRWQSDDARVVAMLGTADAGLLIATRRGDDGANTSMLHRLSLDDGHQTAAWTADGTPAGRGTLADGTVFWPVGHRTPSGDHILRVELLDAGTLARRRPPIDCGPTARAAHALEPDTFPDARVQLVVANGSIVIADAAITCLRPASDRGPDAPSR